ncbi:MAG: hypothetical protein CL961_00645 [Euryarchaeota archaeon]|nr:hypothetical protein [Euryarchaeota archaeon]
MFKSLTNVALMHQEWHDLLFLHWRIPDSLIRKHIPDELSIDHYGGSAWIGIIPFQMRKLRPTLLPAFPPISNFIEVNLRTYVYDREQRKGVWFFSLDTRNSLGNWIARTFFHLNYRFAYTDLHRDFGNDAPHVSYGLRFLNNSFSKKREESFIWTHDEHCFKPSQNKNSLEYFLTERYRLFSYNYRKKQLITGRLSHLPYELNRPKLMEYSTGLFDSNGIEFNAQAPESVLACHQTHVKVYPFEVVQ